MLPQKILGRPMLTCRSTRVAAGAAALYGAYVLYKTVAKRLRVRALGAVPFEDREGTRVAHGGRVECGPAESFLAKYGATLRGTWKTTLCVTVEGAVAPEAVAAAASGLFARHPILRSKLVSSDPAGITRTCQLAFEIDESMDLPVAFHEEAGAESLAAAAEGVWRSFEQVCVCVCVL